MNTTDKIVGGLFVGILPIVFWSLGLIVLWEYGYLTLNRGHLLILIALTLGVIWATMITVVWMWFEKEVRAGHKLLQIVELLDLNNPEIVKKVSKLEISYALRKGLRWEADDLLYLTNTSARVYRMYKDSEHPNFLSAETQVKERKHRFRELEPLTRRFDPDRPFEASEPLKSWKDALNF